MVPKALAIYDPFSRAAFLLRDKFTSRGAVGEYILSINGVRYRRTYFIFCVDNRGIVKLTGAGCYAAVAFWRPPDPTKISDFHGYIGMRKRVNNDVCHQIVAVITMRQRRVQRSAVYLLSTKVNEDNLWNLIPLPVRRSLFPDSCCAEIAEISFYLVSLFLV